MTCWPPRCGYRRPRCRGSRRGGGAPGTPPRDGWGPARGGAGSPGTGWPRTGSGARPPGRRGRAAGGEVRRGAGGRRPAAQDRARAGRGDPLAVHRGQPVPRADVGGRGRADAQADRAHHADHGRAAVPDAVRAGGVPGRPGRPAGGGSRRGRARSQGAVPGRGQGAAAVRIRPGAVVVTARPWLTLWLLRKAVRMFGGLALFALAAAGWPVTLVAITGYGTAWLRGWPPVRLRRAAAWSLP